MSHAPPEALHTVVAASSMSAGQLAELPVQVSAGSQAPADALHTVVTGSKSQAPLPSQKPVVHSRSAHSSFKSSAAVCTTHTLFIVSHFSHKPQSKSSLHEDILTVAVSAALPQVTEPLIVACPSALAITRAMASPALSVTGSASTVTAGEAGSIVAIRYPTVGSDPSSQVTVISVSQGAIPLMVNTSTFRVAQPLSTGDPRV
jgi:hypothetical protein